MEKNLAQKYDHSKVEEGRYNEWVEAGYFTAGDKSKDTISNNYAKHGFQVLKVNNKDNYSQDITAIIYLYLLVNQNVRKVV